MAGVAALFATVASAEVSLHMEADRTEVGLSETFSLTLEVEGASADDQVELPEISDAQVLSRSQSSQRMLQFGSRGAEVRRIEKYTLLVRPARLGKLVIPPAHVRTPQRRVASEAVVIEVVQGRPQNARPQRAPRPGFPQGFGFPDDDLFDSFFRFPEERLPQTESDLFIRSYVDKSEVFVGEQVTLSVYIFSRVDLSSVDAVSLPKLDGFWTEDIASPTQLQGESRTIDGLAYRAYLLKRRALFPVKPGTTKIAAAEADITTGFLFSGRRLHRVGNSIALKVKAPPSPAPPGFQPEHVGAWQLSAQVEPREVELGKPVTLQVAVEGWGNAKRLVLPRPQPPASVRIYDPATTDAAQNKGNRIGGRRVQEYLLVAQQTGEWTLPPLAFVAFNPATGEYETSRTEPITVAVKAGPAGTGSATGALSAAAKNVLTPGALRPLRHEARFLKAVPPPWERRLFWGFLGLPVVVAGLASLGGIVVQRRRVRRHAAADVVRDAKASLKKAERLGKRARNDVYFSEVERALHAHLSARLGESSLAYSRAELAQRLSQAGVPETESRRTLGVLEACEMGRYAPGAFPKDRDVLAEARAIVEGRL
ncbi:MAG: BatD family protein [Myxococcaceae bacterium]